MESDPAFAKMYEGHQQRFKWLIDHLLPPNNRFKSCPVPIPETVFFSQSHPKFKYSTDEKGYLRMETLTESSTSLANIQTQFAEKVRE